MAPEIYHKKIEQISQLLDELEELLSDGPEEFQRNTIRLRAAERDFQLIVNLAVDINAYLLVDKTGKTPDSYRASFLQLSKIQVLSKQQAEFLSESALLRNILVHEYDIELDVEKFYNSARKFIEAYRAYLKSIFSFIQR